MPETARTNSEQKLFVATFALFRLHGPLFALAVYSTGQPTKDVIYGGHGGLKDNLFDLHSRSPVLLMVGVINPK